MTRSTGEVEGARSEEQSRELEARQHQGHDDDASDDDAKRPASGMKSSPCEMPARGRVGGADVGFCGAVGLPGGFCSRPKRSRRRARVRWIGHPGKGERPELRADEHKLRRDRAVV